MKIPLTWVRQTKQHHIYLCKWPGAQKGFTFQVPKYELFNPTQPPKEVLIDFPDDVLKEVQQHDPKEL